MYETHIMCETQRITSLCARYVRVMCITVARGDETATKTPGHALCAHITRTFHDLAHSNAGVAQQAWLSRSGAVMPWPLELSPAQRPYAFIPARTLHCARAHLLSAGLKCSYSPCAERAAWIDILQPHNCHVKHWADPGVHQVRAAAPRTIASFRILLRAARPVSLPALLTVRPLLRAGHSARLWFSSTHGGDRPPGEHPPSLNTLRPHCAHLPLTASAPGVAPQGLRGTVPWVPGLCVLPEPSSLSAFALALSAERVCRSLAGVGRRHL